MLLCSNYYTYAHDATTAIGIIYKYIGDIQTNEIMGDKPLEFWLNSCLKDTASCQFWLLISYQHQPYRPS